jgi:hypothetical protein
MFKKLEFWGGAFTVIYLFVIGAFVTSRFDDFLGLKLNELGDFLAGSFGPIAFLWLVLGFLQQGRELKLSTDALKLQAEELKNSVEQQTIMAQAATAQIDAQLKTLQIQQAEVERSVSPILRFDSGFRNGGLGAGAQIKTDVTVSNGGKEVWDVEIEFSPAIGTFEAATLGRLTGGGRSSPLSFEFLCGADDVLGSCTVAYTRADGQKRKELFEYRIEASNPFIRIDKPRPVPVG